MRKLDPLKEIGALQALFDETSQSDKKLRYFLRKRKSSEVWILVMKYERRNIRVSRTFCIIRHSEHVVITLMDVWGLNKEILTQEARKPWTVNLQKKVAERHRRSEN